MCIILFVQRARTTTSKAPPNKVYHHIVHSEDEAKVVSIQSPRGNHVYFPPRQRSTGVDREGS